MNDELALKPERPIRRVVYAFGVLFFIAVCVLVVINARVAQRIRRINDRGGTVKSWSPNLLAPLARPFGHKVEDWVEDKYVVRQQYEVYFGDLDRASGCGSGVTLWESPDAPFDVGDDGPALAHELRGITQLSLATTSVTDTGLMHLRGMTLLEILDLDSTQIHGPGLVHLRDLPLKILSLHGTPMDDAGLDQLPELPSLQILDLGKTRIIGPGLARLRKFPALISLDLSGTRITDDVVRELSALPFEYLDLSDTPISDTTLTYLEKMPQLRNVNLCNTGITIEAARRSHMDALRNWLDLRVVFCHHGASSP